MFPILYSLTCIQKNVFIPVSPILMRLTLNKDRFNKSEALLLFLWGKNKNTNKELSRKGNLFSDAHFQKLLQRSASHHLYISSAEAMKYVDDLSPPEQEPLCVGGSPIWLVDGDRSRRPHHMASICSNSTYRQALHCQTTSLIKHITI